MKRPSILAITILVTQILQAQQFQISYTNPSYTGPFTGHVILYLSKQQKNPARNSINPATAAS